MPSQPTNAGIITDESSGQRHIPESVRADGSTRKAIKIRPGYRPPEDVEVYKNRAAETFRNRGKGPVIGSEAFDDEDADDDSSSAPPSGAAGAANKNAKRREARRKAKAAAAAAGEPSQDDVTEDGAAPAADEATAAPEKGQANAAGADGDAEREKKARNLRKKLKQAKDLKSKKEGGEALLPEQIAKVIKINELIRELDALGFDADGEPKANDDEVAASTSNSVAEKAPA